MWFFGADTNELVIFSLEWNKKKIDDYQTVLEWVLGANESQGDRDIDSETKRQKDREKEVEVQILTLFVLQGQDMLFLSALRLQ